MFFVPSMYNIDPVFRVQMLSFLADGTVMITLWTLESIRRANELSIIRLYVL